jgi:hypothetical protein
MFFSTLVVITLAAREPLPIPGWTPAQPQARGAAVSTGPTVAPEATPPLVQAEEAPPEVVEAPAAQPEARRNVALTFGLGALVMSPSVELEVAPWRHVSLYAGVEASALQLGGGGQAGVRLRPLDWLEGPFLDVHVRFSRYAGLLVGPSVEETANPGVMAGFSWVSEGGLVITGGLGLNFFTKTTTTNVRPGLVSGTYFPIPTFDVTRSTRIGPALETRLAIGWAL